jgi:hypothetical protein
METVPRYRGRDVTVADVEFIQELIASHPGLSRRRLSAELCEAWDWRQSNGALKDMVCRGLMLALSRACLIELPALKKRPCNPLLRRTRPQPIEVDESRIETSLASLAPLEFRQVRRTNAESLFNCLLHGYHYLGYSQPVGEQLKFMVYSGDRPVALFAWSSAPRHLGPRDRYIGWGQQLRKQNIRYIAYNTRYLVLPWSACRTWPRIYSHA